MNKQHIYFLISGAIILLMAGFFIMRNKENSKEFLSLMQSTQEDQSISIMFVGDIMLDRGIRYYALSNGGNDYIFKGVRKMLLDNDLVVANLEGPITDNESVSSGTIPGSADNFRFTFDPSWAETLFRHNIKLVDLGNNHIENFGKKGIEQTEQYLSASGVGYFGNPYGDKSIIKEIKGIKIGFVSYNQFVSDLAGEWDAVIEEINAIKKEADVVIVFCHWGLEYKIHPSPEQIDLGHKFVDAGADLVVGAHPHVVQTAGEYQGKKIYYSLGNFVFDQYFSKEVRRGLALKVTIDKKTKKLEFSEIKTYLESGGQTIIKEQ